MTIKSWSAAERPREKLLEKGPQALSDAELVAILWRTGIPGKTAVDLARELLVKFGGLRKLLEADQQEVCQVAGIGLAKYAIVQAALEISRRYLYSNLGERKELTRTIDTKYYLSAKLRHKQQEIFACVFLDNRHRVVGYEELFFGTINQSNVYPREVIKRALYHNAAAVILAHNHPSGIADPSSSDKYITVDLKKALALIDVRVLDHIIVGDDVVFSMLEAGLLK
jgi:DNA repair protein RadC